MFCYSNIKETETLNLDVSQTFPLIICLYNHILWPIGLSQVPPYSSCGVLYLRSSQLPLNFILSMSFPNQKCELKLNPTPVSLVPCFFEISVMRTEFSIQNTGIHMCLLTRRWEYYLSIWESQFVFHMYFPAYDWLWPATCHLALKPSTEDVIFPFLWLYL